jgi:glycosyltransferase involved in cell wall biosynthesis
MHETTGQTLSFFSIIVPVYNSADTLGECLSALTGQDYPAGQFEVIVVNDGSTDASAQIAAGYDVRLIDLGANRGRIVARNTGAEAARFDTLVFNDAGVIPGPQLLARVNGRGYQPLMPETDADDGSTWGYPRLFFLLRSRWYAPYYPASPESGEYLITPENFNAVPKGTGCFVCDRSLWLRSQPASFDRFTSDDTRILKKIVEERPILRTPSIRVRYLQRTAVGRVLPHVFQRGPLFADFYLRPGGKYRTAYLAAWMALGLFLLGALSSAGFFLFLGGLLIAGLLAAAFYLGRRWTDIPLVCLYLPPLALAFVWGILKWQVAEWRKRPRL